MNNFKIILPGEAPVKKNSMGKMHYSVNKKTGVKIPLTHPYTYYSKAYVLWAKRAVLTLVNWKRNNPANLKLPLANPLIITLLFFRKHKGRIDLSNLYEGSQDLLGGTAGNFLDKVKRGKKLKFNHEHYKVLADDNTDIIVNHGASKIFHVPFEEMCRTEIFFTLYDHDKWEYIFKYLYPDLEIGINDDELKLKL